MSNLEVCVKQTLVKGPFINIELSFFESQTLHQYY